MNEGNRYLEKLKEAGDYIASQVNFTPDVAVILGSGLGELSNEIENKITIPYEDIPHFPVSTVAGHVGELILGTMNEVKVAFFNGRVHLYEGYSAHDVAFGLRTIGLIGTKKLIITNSAGGINQDLKIGDLMFISDHISLFGEDPTIGVYTKELGELFYDMYNAYDEQFLSIAKEQCSKLDIPYKEGVYAIYKGCSYETKSEIRMLKNNGADAVGKSTVPEVLAAKQMGLKVMAISCISSSMTLDSAYEPLTHEEVLRIGKESSETFRNLVKNLIHVI